MSRSKPSRKERDEPLEKAGQHEQGRRVVGESSCSLCSATRVWECVVRRGSFEKCLSANSVFIQNVTFSKVHLKVTVALSPSHKQGRFFVCFEIESHVAQAGLEPIM